MKYVWITQHRDSFPVAVMCHVLRVSASGYYASLDRTPSRRAQRHERIQQAVKERVRVGEIRSSGAEIRCVGRPLLAQNHVVEEVDAVENRRIAVDRARVRAHHVAERRRVDAAVDVGARELDLNGRRRGR